MSHIYSTLHRLEIKCLISIQHSMEIKCLISIKHSTVCNYGSVISQLRVLASHTRNLGSVAQGALELELWKIRKCHFLVTLACLAISSKKKCLQRLFTYHLKAHTISNKLVIEVSAQKKRGKVMTATNMCSNFGGKWDSTQ